MDNKKGFTLIELIAVIVILGVLMLLAIPAISRYIDNSKKEAFIKEINSLVDTIRYGINSGDSNYSMNGQTKRTFALEDTLLEKGENTVISGTLTVDTVANVYKVKVTKEKNNYCLSLTDVSVLNKTSIKDCNSNEYEIGNLINYNQAEWYVIKDSKLSEDYVVLLKKNLLSAGEIGDDFAVKNRGDNTARIAYYWSDTCLSTSSYQTCPGLAYSNSYSNSGCKNDFEDSKMKEFLNAYMESNEMTEDLEEVDGYKIRLITLKELQDNFDLSTEKLDPQFYNYYYVPSGKTPPSFIYSFGINVHSYWTMSADDSNTGVYVVSDEKKVYSSFVGSCGTPGVRPVINLKKSAI